MRFFYYVLALLLCTVEGHFKETSQQSKAEDSVSHANHRNPSWSLPERFLGLWNVLRESGRTLVMPRRWLLPRSDIILTGNIWQSLETNVSQLGSWGRG